MKYIVILADGMADYPVDELGGKTPMQVAHKPNIDSLAAKSEVGVAYNVPESLSPGSDVANLSAMGYDPLKCYTGRSPLEAVSMGIDIKSTDMIFRCNVVNITEDEQNYEDKIITDHSADEISTEEARELILAVAEAFSDDKFSFYPGVSYRHALVWDNGPDEFDLTPPHDVLERRVGDYLPKGINGAPLAEMMKKSYDILNEHPVNLARAARGLKKANSIWIWGEGRKPSLENFESLHGIKGSVISAVDLIKGIGICAGLDSIDVEGATGNIHTNFDGKARACLDAITSGSDYVFVHMEAPDECGHRGEADNKVKSIELIDKEILGYMMNELDKAGEHYKILLTPDHPTPISARTHTLDAVPFVIYKSNQKRKGNIEVYDEKSGYEGGVYLEDGYKLMDLFLKV